MCSLEAVGKTLVVLSEFPDVRGIVVGPHDCFPLHRIALQTRQERLGQVAGVPLRLGFPKPAAQLMEHSLGQ